MAFLTISKNIERPDRNLEYRANLV